jgi:small-conductance mechanosensitive channel
MRLFTNKMLGVVLAMAMFLISSQGLAKEPSKGDQTSGAKQETAVAPPDLDYIIPSAAELSGRLVALKNKIKGWLDISQYEKKYDRIKANLKGPADQLQRLKISKGYKYDKLVELREIIKQENKLFEETSKPINSFIRQLGDWRKEWLAEKKRWNEWQSFLLKEKELDQLKPTFKKAKSTIGTALDLVHSQLESMLKVQEKAGHIQTKITTFTAELDGLIDDERRGSLFIASPPMFSSQYISQFSRELWHAVLKGLDMISWPGSRFFDRQGWIILIQFFLSLFVIISIYRNRKVLEETKRWRFLAARPVSSGLFLGYMATVLIYEYEAVQATWELAITMVGGISFIRLMGVLIEVSWKRRFVYGVIIIYIATILLDALSFPLPLFRLYIVFASAAGLVLCLRWAEESRRHKDSSVYIWSLRFCSLFFAVIIIVEVWGKVALALYFFVSLLDSIATVFVFMLIIYMIRGSLEWLFRTTFLQQTKVLHADDIDVIIPRLARIIDFAIWGLIVLPAILMTWKVYNTLEEATKGLLTLGFNLGSLRISVGLLIISGGILYISFLTSWILQKLLMDEMIVKRRMEKGVRHSMARLVHYVIIFVGFLLALSALGIEITKLTIMISALGIGIGFGLQNIVNNFVSGLILLFEGPVRMGDIIEMGGKWAEIKRIGLRATTVQTLDQADLIIPNADLVSNQVTNWTLSNRLVRLAIPVGVAYGSDVTLVIETLMECGNSNPLVAKTRVPQVLFLNFGASSLDFELRVWVLDADYRMQVKSELHQEIDRRFREANIEIAFPQQDLHLRSMDESIILQPLETKKVME